MKLKTLKIATSLKLQAACLLFAVCTLNHTLAQQYGWIDMSSRLPDYPHDTNIINGGADTLIANLTDIYFIDDNNGWITTSSTYTSEEAAILHTTDGGNTWEVQTVMRPCSFIHMEDESTGFAASSGGTIYKTSDGGQNWMLFGVTGTNVTGMSFPLGSDTGYICSYEASKMHRITPEGLETINFDNAPFWWQSISVPSHDIIWLSSVTSVYVFDQQGLTDQPVTSDNYSSIYFKRNDLGWGCGSHGVRSRNQGTIMGCVGKNIPWVVLSYTDGPLYDVFALDEDHIWAAGAEGQIYYSANASDFGFNTQTNTGWSNVECTKQTVPRPDASIRSIFFTSAQNGFASANENVLLKYGLVSGIEEQGGKEAWGQGGMGAWGHGGVEVWPNPTRGVISLKSSVFSQQSAVSSQQAIIVEMIDLYGKVLESRNLEPGTWNPGTWNAGAWNAGALQLDISNYPAEIYFVRMKIGNELIVTKIVKL